jgi:hypothetical protein
MSNYGASDEEIISIEFCGPGKAKSSLINRSDILAFVEEGRAPWDPFRL